MKIVVTAGHSVRPGVTGYHACIEGHSEMWGCGVSVDEAIGSVIRSHQAETGVSVILSPEFDPSRPVPVKSIP